MSRPRYPRDALNSSAIASPPAIAICVISRYVFFVVFFALAIACCAAPHSLRSLPPHHSLLLQFRLDNLPSFSLSLFLTALPTPSLCQHSMCCLLHAQPSLSGYAAESFAMSWPTLVCRDLKASCHTAAWYPCSCCDAYRCA